MTQRGYSLFKTHTEDLEAAVASPSSDEQRAELQRNLRYWRARLATAQVAPPAPGDAVAFGTRVTIEQGGEVGMLTIVGHDEAEPSEGLVAFVSPLARSIMGAESSQTVDLPGSDEAIRVISVERG